MRAAASFVALLLVGPGPAAAQSVAVAPDGVGVAVALRTDDGWQVWHAADGTRFVRVLDSASWVHAVGLGADGDVLVLRSERAPREGALRLTRIGSSVRHTVLEGTSAYSAAHLRVAGRRVVVLEARGAHRSVDGGAHFRRAATFDEGYGFYAASVRMGPRGRVDVLAPRFDTCTSSDRLEGLRSYRVGGGGRLPVPAEDEWGGDVPVLAPGRALIVARFEPSGGGCALVRHRRGERTTLMTLPPDIRCWARGAASTEAAVLVVGDARVVRVEGAEARVLDTAEGDTVVQDLVPYGDGALVLEPSGRLRWLREGHVPTIVWAGPPPVTSRPGDSSR